MRSWVLYNRATREQVVKMITSCLRICYKLTKSAGQGEAPLGPRRGDPGVRNSPGNPPGGERGGAPVFWLLPAHLALRPPGRLEGQRPRAGSRGRVTLRTRPEPRVPGGSRRRTSGGEA